MDSILIDFNCFVWISLIYLDAFFFGDELHISARAAKKSVFHFCLCGLIGHVKKKHTLFQQKSIILNLNTKKKTNQFDIGATSKKLKLLFI